MVLQHVAELVAAPSSSPLTTMMFRAASLLALVAHAAAQSLVISAPAVLVQCQPAQVAYVGTGPVFVSIIPGGQASAAPLQDLGVQTASPFTWRGNLPGGTYITFQIRDSEGAVAYSAPIIVQDSADASCIRVQTSTTTTDGDSAAATGVSPSGSPVGSNLPGSGSLNTAVPNAKISFVGLLGLVVAVAMA